MLIKSQKFEVKKNKTQICKKEASVVRKKRLAKHCIGDEKTCFHSVLSCKFVTLSLKTCQTCLMAAGAELNNFFSFFFLHPTQTFVLLQSAVSSSTALTRRWEACFSSESKTDLFRVIGGDERAEKEQHLVLTPWGERGVICHTSLWVHPLQTSCENPAPDTECDPEAMRSKRTQFVCHTTTLLSHQRTAAPTDADRDEVNLSVSPLSPFIHDTYTIKP